MGLTQSPASSEPANCKQKVLGCSMCLTEVGDKAQPGSMLLLFLIPTNVGTHAVTLGRPLLPCQCQVGAEIRQGMGS